MSENTKERSLEKLFGTSRNVRKASDGAEGQIPPAEAAVPEEATSKSTRKHSSRSRASPKQSKNTAKGKATTNSDSATSGDSEEEVGPGGYLGKGRYKRGDGVLVKPSIYIRPDQAHALRMSAAAKDDPNGETMSDIIQSLLDQNGYCNH